MNDFNYRYLERNSFRESSLSRLHTLGVVKSIYYIIDTVEWVNGSAILTKFAEARLPHIAEALNYSFKPSYLNEKHPNYNNPNLCLGKRLTRMEFETIKAIGELHVIYIKLDEIESKLNSSLERFYRLGL